MSNRVTTVFYAAVVVTSSFCVALIALVAFSTKASSGMRLLQPAPTPAIFLPLIQVNAEAAGTKPPNQPPSVNAGPDQLITFPNQVSLNGTVTDDGLPAPAQLSKQWSQLSGPGTVIFTNATIEDSAATFSMAGEYVLQLQVSDGEQQTRDQVNITVNQPPVVDAGADQTIMLPAKLQLNGKASDDGLPNPPGLVTLRWSKLSGPGIVTFATADVQDTTATFTAAGNYTLQLTADDGAQPRSDQVQIIVKDNQPPTVNAGADQTVTVLDHVQLHGTASDDSLPNPPGALNLLWSKVSGAGLVTFTDATVANTTMSVSQAGVYALQLTANDGATSVSDQVTITVKSLDGLWQGSSTQNNLIAFAIKEQQFISFTTSYQIGDCSGATTITHTLPLTNNFAIEQSGPNRTTIRTTGTFDTPTMASGQITVTGSTCGNTVGNWSATKQAPPPTRAYAIADASVIEGAPNLNDGQDGTTWVGYEHCRNAKITRSLMKFDLAAVPAGAAIAQAKLHLYLYGSCDLANRTHTISVYSVSDAWEENTVTWNTQPTIGQVYGAGSVQSRSYDWYTIDITALVKQWASNGLPNNGLMLRGPEGAGNDSAMLAFLTRDAPAGYAPYLEVTYTEGVQAASTQTPASELFDRSMVQLKDGVGASVDQSASLFKWEQRNNQPARQD